MGKRSFKVGVRRVEISSAEKMLFPRPAVSKGRLAAYYARVGPTMLPHVRGRPLTLQRFPDGLQGGGFYQKNAPDHFPAWIPRARVDKEDGTVDHAICDDVAVLVYLAGQAVITPHVWLSRADRPRRPDRMIVDLDPPDDDLGRLRAATRALRELLDELELPAWLMTTGSRGYHVVVPLQRTLDVDDVRRFARDACRLLAARHPDDMTVETRKSRRGSRVFLDYLRNGYAQTTVAPYAVRARSGAPVATPLDWRELRSTAPQRYTIENVLRRLGQRQDPWARIARSATDLAGGRARLDRLLAQLPDRGPQA